MGKAFKWETESFNALPMRCKEMFFEKMTEYMVSGNGGYEIFSAIGFDYDCCKSPIEKIFCFAFDILCMEKSLEFELYPQCEIRPGFGKKYIADFCFRTDVDFLDIYTPENGLKLIIECDGHDYHSSKAQIKHDNERDFYLKSAGYEVLHFSGSQIYEDPWKCAEQTISFILEKLGKLTEVDECQEM